MMIIYLDRVHTSSQTSMNHTIPTLDSRLVKSADGCMIYAEATGIPQNPHVVLIHGMTFCGALFDNICSLPQILEKLYIVRYDLRGHGRSGKPETAESHTSGLYADDFMAVTSEFDLQNPILAGWSFGGQVAIDLAANISPLPIAGVFYINSTSIGSVSGRPIMREIMTLEANVATSAQALTLMRKVCFGAPGVPPLSFYEDCFMAGIQVMQPYDARRVAMRRYKNPVPYLTALKEGKVKVFVCYGAADQMLDGTILSKEMQETARYVDIKAIEGGSHVVFMQYPEIVANNLIAFVQGFTTHK
ncbi:Alpha/Beta hydrolase protein [Lentinula aciculospora]|uniref:Alpha/Beta hydrolase protein n=1 Tax=Lentinula aciculospora TaxID=153920 RepID=A0A9W8ZTB8_9AGAR|nr:Alpha/Beta hydrolase protein [Lentinula aciculospora]KAJ4467083.1 Alpha/Beta hydrolase protein [Lentinula aciculospora]